MGLLNNCWVQEMKNIVALLSIMLLSGAAQAFEFEGYASGMTRAEVESKASKYGKTSVVDGDLIAEYGNANYLSFNFCNDHLVSLQQGSLHTLGSYR